MGGREGSRAGEMQLAEKQAELQRTQVETETMSGKRKAEGGGGRGAGACRGDGGSSTWGQR